MILCFLMKYSTVLCKMSAANLHFFIKLGYPLLKWKVCFRQLHPRLTARFVKFCLPGRKLEKDSFPVGIKPWQQFNSATLLLCVISWSRSQIGWWSRWTLTLAGSSVRSIVVWKQVDECFSDLTWSWRHSLKWTGFVSRQRLYSVLCTDQRW